MSDIAALTSLAPTPADKVISAGTRPLRDGALADNATADRRNAKGDSKDQPGFQAVLARTIGTPPPAPAPKGDDGNAPEPALPPAYPAAYAPMLMQVAATSDGNLVPTPGKSLPPTAMTEPAADAPLGGMDATTLALAGAMAAASQWPTPAPVALPPANGPAQTAAPASPLPLTTGQQQPGNHPDTKMAAQVVAPAANTPAIAALMVPAALDAAQMQTAAAQQIILDAPGQSAADLSQTPTPRLRLVPTGLRTANSSATLVQHAGTSTEAMPAAPLSPFPDDASAQELPTTPLSPASASTAQTPFAHPEALGGAATPQNSPIPTNEASGSTDFAALVDRLVEARAAARSSASPQVVQASIAHGQFGPVGLRFEQGRDGLSVSMTSADPEFARSAQAALAAQPAIAPAAASGEAGASGSDRSHSQQSSAGSPAGFAARQGDSGNFGQSGQQPGQQSERQPSPGGGRIASAADPALPTSGTPAGPHSQSGILV